MSNDNALLSAQEIADLTGKVKYKAQGRALLKMGIRHALRPDGSPVVARAFVAAILARYAENPPAAAPVDDAKLINLDALRKRRTGRKA